jgi:hypothetical protein
MKKGQQGAPAWFSAGHSTVRFLDGWKITFISVFILSIRGFKSVLLNRSGFRSGQNDSYPHGYGRTEPVVF